MYQEFTKLQREIMQKYKLDALVTMSPENITYLCIKSRGAVSSKNHSKHRPVHGAPASTHVRHDAL